MGYLHSIDKNAKQIGAVNCISKTDEGFEGTNTDWIGFEESIKWQEEHRTRKIEKWRKRHMKFYLTGHSKLSRIK